MMRSMWSAAAGMAVQGMNMDVIANNIANANTTGYKKASAEFQDLLYQTINLAGTSSSNNTSLPTGLQLGHGAQLHSVTRQYTTGNFKTTGGRFDLAIQGDGFFQVLQPDGSNAYTRDGAFSVDQNGTLVNANGDSLVPQITVPQDALTVTVAQDGTISVTRSAQTAPETIGQITLVNFINPAGLNLLGNNLVQPTLASGDPIEGTPGLSGLGTIRQGFLEASNVDLAEEMVNMIVGQRAYEANSKTIQTADSMLSLVNSLKR